MAEYKCKAPHHIIAFYCYVIHTFKHICSTLFSNILYIQSEEHSKILKSSKTLEEEIIL
jgi:hypothetical protein